MMSLIEVKAVLEEQISKQGKRIAEIQRKVDHLDSWGPMWWDRQDASEHTHYTHAINDRKTLIESLQSTIEDLQVFKKSACEFDIETRKEDYICQRGEGYYEHATKITQVLVAYFNKNGYSRGFEQELCKKYDWID